MASASGSGHVSIHTRVDSTLPGRVARGRHDALARIRTRGLLPGARRPHGNPSWLEGTGMTVDVAAWSGEGAFTEQLLDCIKTITHVAAVRVEDAPASRSEADYNFISNEIFVTFTTETVHEPVRLLGMFPSTRAVVRKAMNMPALQEALTALPEIGDPDYADEGMLQYLRSQRIIPPYQTRGYKLVELVRVYEAGSVRHS